MPIFGRIVVLAMDPIDTNDMNEMFSLARWFDRNAQTVWLTFFCIFFIFRT